MHEPWMSIQIFLGEWIFQHGYYHGHCMDTSTRGKVAIMYISFFLSIEKKNTYRYFLSEVV